MSKIKIAMENEIVAGKTLKFPLIRAGRKIDGFLTRFQGQLVAYENRCRHLPVALDAGTGKFYESDGNYFFCQAHGAMYEPLTGLCVRGPCEGESLKALNLEINDGAVWLLETD